jgi:hypothetical protein
MLEILLGVKAPTAKAVRPRSTVKKAREQMLGDMFDSDAQSRWRDSCAMSCDSGRGMQTKI